MSNFNFKQSAINSTTLSPLMANRDKISTQEIIAKYPDGITITDFDLVQGVDTKTGEVKMYPVCLFAENDNVFFNGGTVMARICEDWVQNFNGDVEATAEALKAEGGVKAIFTSKRSKSGQMFTAVTIV